MLTENPSENCKWKNQIGKSKWKMQVKKSNWKILKNFCLNKIQVKNPGVKNTTVKFKLEFPLGKSRWTNISAQNYEKKLWHKLPAVSGSRLYPITPKHCA